METLNSRTNKRLGRKPRGKLIKKILLIDNEVNSALATALEEEGCDVVHCDCVQKAWNFVYPLRPHLIILNLHDSDGTALPDIHECRALAEGVPIVLAASIRINRTILNALPQGAAAIVADSLTPQIVREALRGQETSKMEE